MFTGIVEELGEVRSLTDLGDSVRLTLHGPLVADGSRHGDSIAVNGVCLTVVDTADGSFSADVMRETLDRSALGALAPGSPVNLERPMRLDGRLGGHLVQGHVDGVGRVRQNTTDGNSVRIEFEAPESLMRYIVEKGFIAVDGTSLTVTACTADSFSIAVIPYTLEHTTLGGVTA